MEIIQDTIGDVQIMIQTIDRNQTELIFQEKDDDFNTIPTSVSTKLEDVYSRGKTLIRKVTEDMSDEFEELSKSSNTFLPSEFKITFELGFSKKANAWIFSTGGDCTFSIELTWKKP